MSEPFRKCRKKSIIVEFRDAQVTEYDVRFGWGETILCGIKEVPTFVSAETDYVMRGIKGELYPCNKEVFAETFEIIDE